MSSDPLTQLRAELTSAAGRQAAAAAPRFRQPRSRWRMAPALAATAIFAVVGGAAAGVLPLLDEGTTSDGKVAYQVRADRQADGDICLSVRYTDARADDRSASGRACGSPPSATQPLKVFLASPNEVLGLVATEVASVEVGERAADVREVRGVPGKFFTFRPASTDPGGRVPDVVARDSEGQVIGRTAAVQTDLCAMPDSPVDCAPVP